MNNKIPAYTNLKNKVKNRTNLFDLKKIIQMLKDYAAQDTEYILER